MPNKRRREKKRTKAALTTLKRQGVPQLQGGGTIPLGPINGQPAWLNPGGGGGVPPMGTPNLPPGFADTWDELSPDQRQAAIEAASAGQMLGMDPALAAGFLALPVWLQQEMFGGGGGGGGGGGVVDPFAAGKFDLLVQAQRLDERKQAADAAYQQAQIDIERFTMAGDLKLRQQAEDRLAQAEKDQNDIELFKLQVQASLGQQGIYIDQQGNLIQQRGHDIAFETANLDRDLANKKLELENAIAQGNLQLAIDTQKQIAALEQQKNTLAARGQDVTQRGQDIEAEIAAGNQQLEHDRILLDQAKMQGDQTLARDIEARMRTTQQQNAVLDQQRIDLERSGQGTSAVQGAGDLQARMAQALGDIEARRNEFQTELYANPRDYIQSQVALGGGRNPIEQLLQTGTLGSSSIGNIGGTPMVGQGFQDLVDAISARPDLAYFDEAMQTSRDLKARAGELPPGMTLEEILKLGALPPISEAPAAPITPREITPPAVPREAPLTPAPLPEVTAQVPTPGNLQKAAMDEAQSLYEQAFKAKAQGNMAEYNRLTILFKAARDRARGAVQPTPAPVPQLPPAVAPLGPESTRPPVAVPTVPIGGVPTPVTPPGPTDGGWTTPGRQIRPEEEAVAKGADPIAAAIAEQKRLGLIPMATGGNVVVNEPLVGIGLRSGKARLTLNERGPELLSPIPTGGTKVTPMQTGGKTTSIGAPRPTTPNPYIPGGSLGNAGSWMVPPGGGSPSRNPYIPGGSLNPRPIPIGTKTQPFMPAVRPDIPNFRRLQPRPGLEAPQTRPGGPGYPVPTPVGGGQPWGGPVAQSMPAMPTPTPIRPQFTQGQLLRNIQMGLTPRKYFGMDPTQRGLLGSIISGLGMSPEEFWWRQERGFPGGIDPSQITSANFWRGGNVLVA